MPQGMLQEPKVEMPKLQDTLDKWKPHQSEQNNEHIMLFIDSKSQKVNFKLEDLSKKFAVLLSKNIYQGITKKNRVLLEEIRNCLKAVLGTESRNLFSEDIYELAFHTQLILTLYFPLNEKNLESGLYTDMLTLDDISEKNRVLTSSGHMYSKETLIQYFQGNNIYEEVDGVVRVKDPLRNILSSREIEYLRGQGIRINTDPPRIPFLAINANSIPMRAAVWGAWLALLTAVIIELFIYALLPLKLPYNLTMLTVLGTGTAYVSRQQGDVPFWRYAVEIFNGMFTGTVLAGVLLPSVVSGLASTSIISASTAAFLMLNMPLMLAAVPVAMFVAGMINGCYRPSGFIEVFTVTQQALYLPCVLIGGMTGFTLGALFERCFCPRAQLREPIPQPERVAEPIAPAASANSSLRAYRGLGVEPQPQSSVRTSARADGEERPSASANETVILLPPPVVRGPEVMPSTRINSPSLR